MLLSRFGLGFPSYFSGVCYGFTPIFATYAYQEEQLLVSIFSCALVAAVCFFLYIAVLKRNCIRMVGRIVVFFTVGSGHS